MRTVRVHWNIHKGGFVIRNLPARTGDMLYVDRVCLRDARFVVQRGGLRAIRASGARNVCAYVTGELCHCREHTGDRAVAFNPYREDSFVVRGTKTAVRTADHVSFRIVNGKPETLIR